MLGTPRYANPLLRFHFSFAYTSLMLMLPQSRHCDFIIACKGCGENIPAPVGTMPDTWIIADCPLCGAKRRYLPTDIFQGRLSFHLERKPVRSETQAR
jgi:hypothetical protein